MNGNELIEERYRAELRSAEPRKLYSVIINIGKEALLGLRAEVAPFLESEQGALRGAALRVLGFYWRLPEYRVTAEHMAMTERDSGARRVALMVWSSYEKGTKDKSVLLRLYKILVDETAAYESRASAYDAMMDVAGIELSARPDILTGEDLLAAIDWMLVRRMLEGTGVVPQRALVSGVEYDSLESAAHVSEITYKRGVPDDPTSRFGTFTLLFAGAIGVVHLRHDGDGLHRAWMALMPSATWGHLVQALNTAKFPSPVMPLVPGVPGSNPATVSWVRGGVPETVIVPQGARAYRDVHGICYSALFQFNSGLLNDAPGTWDFPDSEIMFPCEAVERLRDAE